MERTAPRFKLGKQSSLAPDRSSEPLDEAERKIDPRVIGSGTDLDEFKELIGFGTDANFRDVDGRTALHVATCKGFGDVVCFLLRNGISHFATNNVHYNPSDLSGWFESMLSEFNVDNSSSSSVVIYNTFTIVTN